jgi:hypothetical protein
MSTTEERSSGARGTARAGGTEVGEVFHCGPDGRVSGPDPEHRSCLCYVSFSDPDGMVAEQAGTELPA